MSEEPLFNSQTMEKLAALMAEYHHVIQFTDDGWTISHPLSERIEGSLFDCTMRWDGDDPGVRGRFKLFDDGSIGDAYTE